MKVSDEMVTIAMEAHYPNDGHVASVVEHPLCRERMKAALEAVFEHIEEKSEMVKPVTRSDQFTLAMYRYDNTIRVFISPESEAKKVGVTPNSDMILVVDWDITHKESVQYVTSIPYPSSHISQKGRKVESVSNPNKLNDGWIEWKGGKCPVPEFINIDIRTRNLVEIINIYPDNFIYKYVSWERKGEATDIIAYRIIEEKKEPKKQTLWEFVEGRNLKNKEFENLADMVNWLVWEFSEYLEQR